MSMMPTGMPNMDINSLVTLYSGGGGNMPSNNANTYQGVTYSSDHPYVTSGYIKNNNREAEYKEKMKKLRQEAARAAQTARATNKNNPDYWGKKTGLPTGNINDYMGLLGNNAGLTPGQLRGGDQYFVDLLPYTDRYSQLLAEYKNAGGSNRNYGQPGYY